MSPLNKGQELYKKAKKIIPGGTHLLSKRPELFLPDLWPCYFSRAKDCNIWDLAGEKYIDISHMGVGTNSLGYSNHEIDDKVHSAIEKGNMSTLNCVEEVALAEKLIELHDWADMVRFARTGGEANSISIRIARAATGRDKIAICGYHGWHDWYLSANLNGGESLGDHLIPGLNPLGVPKGLKNTIVPFQYNDIEEFRTIIKENPDLAAVKMEVIRSEEPVKGYLEEIRKLCNENNIVLIFDECTSGFRETFGGVHKKYQVFPDLCMFGKALGNGYAITAVIGKRQIMESAQKTFISSTFWTERIGPTAGLASLKEMERVKSWDIITDKGKFIKKTWKRLASTHSLNIEINGMDALAGFMIKSDRWLKYKTYITQSMLERGFLAANVIYCSTKHSDDIIGMYAEHLSEVFEQIEKFERGINSVDDHLKTEVCHSGFKRLN
ncbi:MAG: aminotransferase class III-fold pyridoxal phosphate-dependent enzyme [Schleiferiaceae bacterium]|nr:aminotransferase class III-fold pyridoxal phosphate-dependent enzyme [Schleiferiaceae bacterium]